MASFVRDSVLGQCLRPILNYPSWLQYEDQLGLNQDCGIQDNGIQDSDLQDTEFVCKHQNQTQPQDEDKITLVNWLPDDPEHPHNWPSTKKAFVAFVIGIYSFVVYMSAPIYTPSVEAFRDEFGVNAAEGSLGLALYVLGYGFGPLLFSPISEIPQIGRNLPYVVSFTLFCIISVPTALAPTSIGFYFLRFLQGFFGSPCLATGGASIADVYPESGTALPYAMTTWVLCVFCAPAIGTLASGFAIPVLGWRFSMWEILIAAGPVLVLLFLLPETGHGTILYRRARRLQKQSMDTKMYKSEAEIAQGKTSFSMVVQESLLVPAKITFLDPAILFLNVYTSLTYGIYYSFFEAFPLVYQGIYGFNLGEMGLAFLAIVVGSIISFIVYNYYIYRTQKQGPRPRKPETVLIPALFACFGPAIGLLLFGWAARIEVHWIVPTLGIVIYPASVYILMQCVFMYIPACYPHYAASVFAATDFTRSAFACGAVIFSRPLYMNLGIGRGSTLLAGLTIGCVVGIYLLFWFGESLRKRSKFISKW